MEPPAPSSIFPPTKELNDKLMATLETWAARHPDPDKKVIGFGTHVLSANDIAREMKTDPLSEAGESMYELFANVANKEGWEVVIDSFNTPPPAPWPEAELTTPTECTHGVSLEHRCYKCEESGR